MAKEMLKHNNAGNRRYRKNTVRAYAEAMKNGGWQLSPDGISFYEDGSLRNGQHRLMAIIQSGQTIPMMVTYDVPNNSFICDRGLSRSAGDVLNMAGYSDLSSNFYSGIINFLLQHVKHQKPNDEAVIRFAKDYGETVRLAGEIAVGGKRNPVGRKVAIAAAIFCAIQNGVDEKVLWRFANVLNTGFYDNPAESSAIVVRNMLPTIGKGSNVQWDLFSITTRAIEDFRICNPRKRAYDRSGEPKYWKRVKAYILSDYA